MKTECNKCGKLRYNSGYAHNSKICKFCVNEKLRRERKNFNKSGSNERNKELRDRPWLNGGDEIYC